MTAADLLCDLQRRGAALAIAAGRILVTPPEVLTPADVDALKASKGDLLAILQPPSLFPGAPSRSLTEHGDACGRPYIACRMPGYPYWLCGECGQPLLNPGDVHPAMTDAEGLQP